MPAVRANAASISPLFMAHRQLIELIPAQAPVRHVKIHQPLKTFIVRRLQQMERLMHNDVFKAVAGLLGQTGVQSDVATSRNFVLC